MRNNTLEQVLVGSILGDGSINKNGAYTEVHCLEQTDYLFWKKKIFDKLVFDRQSARITMRCNEQLNRYDMYVPRHSIFQEYRELSYPDGKKIVTNKFIKRIDKLAIVVWYFDDGCYNPRKNSIVLCSMSFSHKENKKLQRMLKDRFGLNFRIGCVHRKTDYPYYLFCNGENTDNFLAFVKKNAPYISKSMSYKMGKLHKGNLKWIEEKMRDNKKSDRAYYKRNVKKIKKQTNEYYWVNRNKMRKIQKYFREYKEKRREHYKKYMRKYYLKYGK